MVDVAAADHHPAKIPTAHAASLYKIFSVGVGCLLSDRLDNDSVQYISKPSYKCIRKNAMLRLRRRDRTKEEDHR